MVAVVAARPSVTPAAIADSDATAFVRQNVATSTIIRIDCADINRLSVINSGSASTGQGILTVGSNPSFIIKRIA